MQASRLKICLLALAIFFLEVLDVTQSLPVGNALDPLDADKILVRQKRKELEANQIYDDVKDNLEEKNDYGVPSLTENAELMDTYTKLKIQSTSFKRERVTTKAATRKKNRSKGKKITLRRKHIARVPQPPYPLFGHPPSGLSDDQKHSGDDEYEENLSAQKEAFEAILDEHQRNPKRTKDYNEDQYIILTYDYKNRKYSIKELDTYK